LFFRNKKKKKKKKKRAIYITLDSLLASSNLSESRKPHFLTAIRLIPMISRDIILF